MGMVQRVMVVQGGLIVCLMAPLSGQSVKPASAPQVALDGQQLFKTYCASCHGESGHGNGPVAESLRHIPPNLARYSARNGGVFPSERLARVIDGRDIPSHGNREMPVWGDAFRETAGGAPAEAIKARIAAIVGYLEKLQVRNGH